MSKTTDNPKQDARSNASKVRFYMERADKFEAQRDAAVAALRVLVDHAKETYPHFESERGQRDIAQADAAIAAAEGSAS